MRALLIVIDTASKNPLDALTAEYAKRLAPHVPLEIIRVPDAKKAASKIPPKAFVVVLDETGECLPTAAFAKKLQNWQGRGVGTLVFLVGGADGHSTETRKAADFIWSLSPLTFPHRFVPLLVAEQLYRAISLINNHPYHRA